MHPSLLLGTAALLAIAVLASSRSWRLSRPCSLPLRAHRRIPIPGNSNACVFGTWLSPMHTCTLECLTYIRIHVYACFLACFLARAASFAMEHSHGRVKKPNMPVCISSGRIGYMPRDWIRDQKDDGRWEIKEAKHYKCKICKHTWSE